MTLQYQEVTRSAREVLDFIGNELKVLGHNTQFPYHVVLAFMVRPGANPAGRTLAKQGTNLEYARTYARTLQQQQAGQVAINYFSNTMKEASDLARQYARESNPRIPIVRTDHLLRAVIEVQDPDTEKLFKHLGINQWRVQADLKQNDSPEA